MYLRAWLARVGKGVADFDALHRVDAEERGGEAAREAAVPVDVAAEAGRGAERHHLKHTPPPPNPDKTLRQPAPPAPRAVVSRAEARSRPKRRSLNPYLAALVRSAWPGRGMVIGSTALPFHRGWARVLTCT